MSMTRTLLRQQHRAYSAWRQLLQLRVRTSRSMTTDAKEHRDLAAMAAGHKMDTSNPTFMVWGSNTGVGKSLVSAGILSTLLSSSSNLLYLKPIQTGFPHDSDSRFVANKLCQLFTARNASLSVSDEVISASAAACVGMKEGARNINGNHIVEGSIGIVERKNVTCKTIYAFSEPVSPHLASAREAHMVKDSEVVEQVRASLDLFHCQPDSSWAVVETAGGVASPGPSGTLQCDLYRPFRLPSILVVDGKLGGISGTVSSYECLCLRGYDVNAVIVADGGLSNEKYLSGYFEERIPVFLLPKIPEDSSNNLLGWFDESVNTFADIAQTLQASFMKRRMHFCEMQKTAKKILWWPFTQHTLVPEEAITVVDSRCGENFAVHKFQNLNDLSKDYIIQQFDACASWWTQGPDASLQAELARAIGNAAARFGHVMYPENVYEPAFNCAELMLRTVGKGWANRVFFSDNGSTAIEIALKMAFRKFAVDRGLVQESSNKNFQSMYPQFKVLALKGSYHGDTLGAMDAQAPTPYTGFIQHPWYSGRGLFLDAPTIIYKSTQWKINLPDSLSHLNEKTACAEASSLAFYFSTKRDDSSLSRAYCDHIRERLSEYRTSYQDSHLAALLIEPIIHAAGGMHIIDPLFQRILIKECRYQEIPVIFDEVFTGFWRLGVESASELLDCIPDIACYAKLLTGGTVPLAATLTTEDIFLAFESKSKLYALLHGHSYSGHAIGCAAAVTAIQWFRDPQKNSNLSQVERRLGELWNSELVSKISSKPIISRVIVLGTLCAFELKIDNSNSGYDSMSASSIMQKLHDDGVYARPLGNVIYFIWSRRWIYKGLDPHGVRFENNIIFLLSYI